MNVLPKIPETELDTLEWQGFECLVQTLLKNKFGLGIEAWGGHGDWGRDAYFNGELRYPKNDNTRGRFMFQCKFVENANALEPKTVRSKILDSVQKECKRICKRKESKRRKWKCPNIYGFCTNAPLKAELKDEVVSRFSAVLPGCKVHPYKGTDVCQWLSLTPELTHGFRADTVLYKRLGDLELRPCLDSLRPGVLNEVFRRACRLDELARASHLFNLGLLMALQTQYLDPKQQHSLLLSAIELIQDVSDENPGYIRHRALLVASHLALTVPGFPWLGQCPRIQAWFGHDNWDGLDLGDHWLIALTVLLGDDNSKNKIATKYDELARTSPMPFEEREHAALNLAEGLRSVLVSTRTQLPSAERVLRVLQWVDLSYTNQKSNLSPANQIRLLLLCGDLINIVKVCTTRAEYAEVIKPAEEKIMTAKRLITRNRIKKAVAQLEKLKTRTSTPPWDLEPTYLSDDDFWLRQDKTGLRDALLDLYDVVVEERDQREYKGAGWTQSWLPYFKDLGRTSENAQLRSISEKAIEKGRGARSS